MRLHARVCACVYMRVCPCVCVLSLAAPLFLCRSRPAVSVSGSLPPLRVSSSSPADTHIYVHLLGARGGIWRLCSLPPSSFLLPPSSFRPQLFLFCFVFPTMEKDRSAPLYSRLFTDGGEQSEKRGAERSLCAGSQTHQISRPRSTLGLRLHQGIQSDAQPFIRLGRYDGITVYQGI